MQSELEFLTMRVNVVEERMSNIAYKLILRKEAEEKREKLLKDHEERLREINNTLRWKLIKVLYTCVCVCVCVCVWCACERVFMCVCPSGSIFISFPGGNQSASQDVHFNEVKGQLQPKVHSSKGHNSKTLGGVMMPFYRRVMKKM